MDWQTPPFIIIEAEWEKFIELSIADWILWEICELNTSDWSCQLLNRDSVNPVTDSHTEMQA